MKYLVVSHIPFGRGSGAGTTSLTAGDMWLEDIRAHVRALGTDGELLVASPLVDQLGAAESGSFKTVEVDPEAEGFRHFALPNYNSMPGYVRSKAELVRALRAAIREATLVHMSDGGHPIPPGQVAWRLAGLAGKPRIWVFDGADPFPRIELHASQERNGIKRAAKQLLLRRFRTFCRSAVRDADLVFAHNQSVVARFSDVWDERRCHRFDRTFVTSDILLSPSAAAGRKQEILAPGPLRLVAAGRQIRIKGTDQLLRAMAAAVGDGANLELEVYGDGEDLPSFKALSADLGLGERVRFPGTVPYGEALFAALKHHHMLVVTNLTAEISRNVMLGMAMGLPLVLYRNPGTDELVRAGNAGILVDTGNVSALAEALVRADRNRQMVADLVDNGLVIAARNTLDGCHRRRVDLAMEMLAGVRPGGADARRPSVAVSQ